MPFVRAARTTTRIGVGTVLILGEKAGRLLTEVANHTERPALPPGPQDVSDDDGEGQGEGQDADSGSDGSAGEMPAVAGELTAVAGAAEATEPDKGWTERDDDASDARTRAIAVGATLAVAETAVNAAGTIGRAGVAVAGTAGRTVRAVTPAPIRRTVETRLDRLAERGRTEGRQSTAAAYDALDQVVAGVASSDQITELIGQIVDRILDPLLDTAIPVALDQLNENPEPVRELIRGQSMGMAEEVANGVRSGAITVDVVLEHIARRILHRKEREDLAPVPNPGRFVGPKRLRRDDE